MIVDPAEDLPEQKALTLLILPPSLSWDDNGGNEILKQRVLEISARCGGKDRLCRNTLVFLAGRSRGLSKLRRAYRERAALQGVQSDYGGQLDGDQKADLKKRLEVEQGVVLEALGQAYTVVLRVAGQDIDACVLPDACRSFQEHLGYVWTTLVEDEGWILRRVGSVTLEKTGLIPKEGSLRLKDAVEAFLRFTDKPMISAREAVTAGLAQACVDGLVGIGRGGSPSTLHARYCKEAVSLDPSEDGVWIIPPFTPEPKEGSAEPGSDGETTTGGEPGSTGGETDGGTTSGKGTGTPGQPGIKRIAVSGTVPVESWSELFRCFVSPAARMNLKKLRLGVQFEMDAAEGQELDPNDQAVKAMREAARQLGLDLDVEE